MAQDSGQLWFGVRAIYHFGTKGDGTNVFEERVVVFCGANSDEAHAKAEAESEEYAPVARAWNLIRNRWPTNKTGMP